MSAARTATPPDAAAFGGSRACFEEIVGWLEGTDAACLSHGELEDDLDHRGRELLRRLLQDHLDLRARREQRTEVSAADGVSHGSVEVGHKRTLATIFGNVTVERLAYRHRAKPNLHPADGVLNLPEERHSHGLRRLAADRVEPGFVPRRRGSDRARHWRVGGQTPDRRPGSPGGDACRRLLRHPPTSSHRRW
jgi:hypothetical protein